MDSVLRTGPKLATFDCDGTLWSGDAGEGFFSWEMDTGLVYADVAGWARARYAAYRQGKVPEEIMCGEMVTLHRGMSEAKVERAAIRYFDEYFVPQIFPEMRDLVHELQTRGCEVWAVSSTNVWVIRAAVRHFGIPEDRIVAAASRVENGVISADLLQVPSGDGKPKAIQKMIGKTPDAAFGNSVWDTDMLAMSKHPFVVNPTQQLQSIARERSWPIYDPAAP